MIVINDRVKVAVALVEKGLIEWGSDYFREIIDETKTTEAQILEKARYYKVDLGVK